MIVVKKPPLFSLPNITKSSRTVLRLLKITHFSNLTSDPGHSISYKIACAPSQDSDQPLHRTG